MELPLHQKITKSPFSHVPLIDPARQIRLLRCSNACTTESHLDLQVKPFSLHRAPAYAAVSYTWDGAKLLDSQESLWLTINGHACPVQQNLRSFLEYFDHSQWKENRPADCWLWVDALCIDQSSTNEKCAQVALMGHIFQNAVCVFAWLGNEAIEEVEQAMSLEDLVLELSGRRNVRSKNYMFADELGTVSLSWAQVYLEDTESADLLEWRQHMWKRFELICKNNYWRRVWIRQEMWLAANITICHRKDSVTWTDFESVFLNLRSQMQNHKNHHHVYYPAWKLSREIASEVVMQRLLLRESLTQGQAFSGLAPLRSLIEVCRGLRSTLLHDYVYGLVGLATDGGKLPIDYSKSIGEVYLDTLLVTQQTPDLILWNRMLLERLGLLFQFKEVAKAVENRAEHGGQWHVVCRGTSRSFILDASHFWADTMNFRNDSRWSQRMDVNPPSWIDAWVRQHGIEHPIRRFPDLTGVSQSNHRARGMDELFEAYSLGQQWSVQSNFAINKSPKMKPSDSEFGGQEFPAEIRFAINKSPASQIDHLADWEARGKTQNKGQSSKIVLGVLGEIGTASEYAQAGDLIVQISNSCISNSHPVYLLARWTGGCFKIVGKVVLLHENNHVSTNTDVDQEERWPTREMLLYLDIRTLHRLALKTTYGG